MADEVKLIDAEKLKRKLIEGDGHDDDRFTEGYNFAINEIREYIDSMPTVEAEPVKHAHWYINPDGYYPQCSNCGYEPPRELIRRNGDALIFPRYCSECGADTKREVR